MTRSLGLVTLVVDAYDEAISFFVGKLGFELIEDSDLGDGKRWVVVRPDATGSGLLLARAKNAAERSAIGNQTGGRVAFFLETADFTEDFRQMEQAGVTFVEEPRQEAYGRVVVFEDLYGNLWDLIEAR